MKFDASNIEKWDRRFLDQAELCATWSKDPSTKVGAAIVGQDNEVIATGYNGFPRGMSDAAEFYENRAFKYEHTIHAESNALINALRAGSSVKGATIYITHPPCPHCAGLIHQAGIEHVVWRKPCADFTERWPMDKSKAHLARLQLTYSEI